ncbi:MAG: YceI family protein [Nannocystaceae bacterium]|nr:YceI family protein [Nannocystaceae bacterium]
MTESRNRVTVFTYKEGLLSRFAHDLRLKCERFELVLSGTALRGRFELGSLRVEGAMQSGRLALGVLSQSDLGKIERTMADDVLESGRFREAVLEATVVEPLGEAAIEGRLELHGRTLPLPRTRVRREQGMLLAELELVPSRWGIAPYRALGGALKLQDRITVRVELVAAEPAAELRWAP